MKIGFFQVGLCKMRASQIRAGEIRPWQICLFEVGSIQVRLVEINPSINGAQMRRGHKCGDMIPISYIFFVRNPGSIRN
jgi:hypothetical protein